ncbi:MAG: cell division protein FtsZ [Limnohabitans sp.]|nr:MAG: cell division protein FtsZ [Limnohabitans sp.]
MSSLQLGLLVAGGVTLLAVILYNQWVSRRNAPRQAQSLEPSEAGDSTAEEASDAQAITAADELQNLTQPERKPVLDGLIDVIFTIDVDQPVSGDAALAALPSTRRVGTKPFHVEGCSEITGEWEPLLPGRRYSAFQAGVQLANRMGPLNEIEFSEFLVKTHGFADAVGGTPSVADMLEEVARARELDQFASAHDAQLSFTLVARAAAWSPGFVHQHAARLGFVAGVIPGRMVLPAGTQGLPPILSLTFDTQAALADDPTLSAVRECTLSLDVPQVPRTDAPFERLRQAAQLLAEQMDGVITDGSGQALGQDVMQQIGQDLEQLYDALDSRDLAAGSAQARRLFS